MVPEIGSKTFYNQYKTLLPRETDFVFIFSDRNLLADTSEKNIRIPSILQFKNAGNDLESLVEINGVANPSLLYLFAVDDVRYFLWLSDEYNTPSGFELTTLFDVRAKYGHEDYLTVFTAWHLNLWYRDNKFCGRCGHPTRIGDKERNLLCDCGNMIFPKIMPAVIVGVRYGDKILMTRYANRAYKGWALIAGFIEIGETAEECVRREVLEETGIHVENVTYFTSQPWGVDQDLLLGFYCDAVGGEDIHVDEFELSTGEWVDRKNVPERTDLQSLTATMMECFRRGLDKETYSPNLLV